MTESARDEEVATDSKWLRENAHLCQVITKSLSGERERPGRTAEWEISIKRTFGFSKDHIHISLSCTATARGKSENPLGKITAEVVGNYRIGSDHPRILSVHAMEFGEEIGIPDVFPYLRQAVDLVAMQIGMGRVKLDRPRSGKASRPTTPPAGSRSKA